MKEKLDITMKSLTVIYLFSFLCGGLVVLCYCLSIDYFPSGVNLGDSLFFISVAIMFSVVYAFYFGFLYGLSLLLVSVIRVPFNMASSLARVRFKKNALQIKKFGSWLALFICLVIGLLAISIYLLIFSSGNLDFARAIRWSILFVSLALILLLLYSEDIEPHINAKMWGSETPHEQRRGIVKIIFILFMLLSPLVLTGSFIHLTKMTITSMGISVKNADIYFDTNVSKFDSADAKNNDYPSFNNVTILWTGIGDGTVVEVKVNDKLRRYVLKTNEITFSY